MVGWGHRGRCGSGTDGTGETLRMAEVMTEDAEADRGRASVSSHEGIKEERPDR